MKILLASNNRGKLIELRQLLANVAVEIISPHELGLQLEVEETEQTYVDNARLKALAFATASGLPTLADDSGLEVAALNGEPGVHTARYAGPGASEVARYRKLLAALADVPWSRRQAQFRAVVVLAQPVAERSNRAAAVAEAEGVCPGQIAFAPAGSGGFGYDPVFYLPEYNCTMAELPEAVKNSISHRARAVQAIRPALLAWTSAPG